MFTISKFDKEGTVFLPWHFSLSEMTSSIVGFGNRRSTSSAVGPITTFSKTEIQQIQETEMFLKAVI